MSFKNNEQVKTLKVNELLNSDEYIIPIYQRNYAWGDEEINLLIQDLWHASQRINCENYYIGSLVVNQRDDGRFEVIDGQQRLTTLTLVMHYLKEKELIRHYSKNVSFEYREESNIALNDPLSENLPSYFKVAWQAIGKYWQAYCKLDEDSNNLAEFLLNRVEIIRTLVPENTDLNHYFEIMNTRGEQLEKHEILKARLMNKLNSEEQAIFGKIWDACSDMSRYIVMGLKSEQRKIIFGEDWQELPKIFDELIESGIFKSKESNKDSKDKKYNQVNESKSILELIDEDKNFTGNKTEEDKEGSFNSVIDFPNFLMHVLRIYLEENKIDNMDFKDVTLDEKFLLETFGNNFDNKDKIKKFLDTLLVCRCLFDNYIIKSSTSNLEEIHWSLKKTVPSKESGHYYKNTFSTSDMEGSEDLDENSKTILMLLSMFHVSNPSRIYKNWLYAVLRYLFKNRRGIECDSYIKFLEELCDRFYFGNYCQEIDFLDIILGNKEFNLEKNETWNDGVNVPNFIFNRLDYQLWKMHKKDYPNFRFTFKSSVEHHYPQNPSDGSKLEKGLNDFGNLYLLSKSKNSRLSNLTPNAKKDYYKHKNYDSLKQALMMKEKDWTETEIEKHGEEMIKILNTPISM